MTAKQFKQWRIETGLSLAGAAKALGLSRATVTRYQRGDYAIPKAVELATMEITRSIAADTV